MFIYPANLCLLVVRDASTKFDVRVVHQTKRAQVQDIFKCYGRLVMFKETKTVQINLPGKTKSV